MLERMNISVLIRAAQSFLWVCIFLLIIAPSSTAHCQDSEDDVEEYFGDDDEYDDEYDDDYRDDDEYDDDEYDDEEYDDEEYDDEEYDDEEYDDEEQPIEDIAEH